MTADSTPAADVLCVVLPLMICALLNAAEAACVYLDDTQLHHMSKTGDPKAARILKMLTAHARAVLTVQLASGFALAVSACFLMDSLMPLLIRVGASADVTVAARWILPGIWSLLFLALGVVAPRRLAGYFPEPIAFALFDLLSLCCGLLRPFAWTMSACSNLLVRLIGKNPDEQPHSVTEEEIRMLVDEGNERGAIEIQEKEMINNIFEFDDRDVSEVMTHRTEVSAVAVNATLSEVVAEAMHSGYSRIPVYEEDIDNVCGVIYAKDLLKYLDRPTEFSIAQEMRRPLYVPESSSCSDVFALLQREKTQIAIVVDEYGGTYGVVTMEDLLESIVGNIQDEYDQDKNLATKIDEGVYILDGSMGVSEFERLLGLRVPDSSEADTLGGFVTELLGGVPARDAIPRSVSFGGVTFTAIHADEKRIDKVRAAIKPA